MNNERLVAGSYDAGWKWMIEHHLAEFLAFYFPDVHQAIDWSYPPEFLNEAFQGIEGGNEVGERRVDKLVKVRELNGRDAFLYAHIEVQGQPRRTFGLRMFEYSYRIYDKLKQHPISLAILSDGIPSWRPGHYEFSRLGTKMRLDFSTAKLLDYDEKALLYEPNPFGMVTLAHRHVIRSRRTDHDLIETKVELIRLLKERGDDKRYIESLTRFLDWIIQIPSHLEDEFYDRVNAVTKEYKDMEYPLTTWERVGLRRGLEQGLRQGIEQGIDQGIDLGRIDTILRLLVHKFGELPDDVVEQVQSIRGESLLDQIGLQMMFATSLDEIDFDIDDDETGDIEDDETDKKEENGDENE